MEQKSGNTKQTGKLAVADSQSPEAQYDELYYKHSSLDRETEEVRETSNRIESAIETVLEHLSHASEDCTNYGEKPTEFSGNITQQSDDSDVRGLVLSILNETRKITEKNQKLVCNLEVSTKEIAFLRQKLLKTRRETLTDALTGISNRKFFDIRLSEEIAAHNESGAPLSLLMIDIDHFKKFNDTYGHQLGDEVIKVVARLLKDGIKGRDAPARYGGEEFAVILPQTCLEDAATVAKHLCATLASRELKSMRTGKSFGTVTVSIGAAEYRQKDSISQFVQRADEALYQAKRRGRNRVEVEIDDKPSLGLAG